MKQFIKDYFSFNKRERNGFIILLFILLITIIFPYLIPLFSPKDNSFDFSAFEKDIARFEKSLEKQSKDIKQNNNTAKEFDYYNIDRSVAEATLHPFYFNPNNLPYEKWKELGLNDKQIKIIKNYEAKGGKFFKKEDLKKIYGISENEYNVLEPFITFPQENKYSKKNYELQKTFNNEKNISIIELNSADSTALKKLKGIGSWYAKKILTYRNKLGGFYKAEQLLEIKGIDSVRYKEFAAFVSVNTFLIKTININTASFDELNKHPYIGYNIALSIVNIRNVHGKYAKVADIKKSALITDKIYEKIFPYITAS